MLDVKYLSGLTMYLWPWAVPWLPWSSVWFLLNYRYQPFHLLLRFEQTQAPLISGSYLTRVRIVLVETSLYILKLHSSLRVWTPIFFTAIHWLAHMRMDPLAKTLLLWLVSLFRTSFLLPSTAPIQAFWRLDPRVYLVLAFPLTGRSIYLSWNYSFLTSHLND